MFQITSPITSTIAQPVSPQISGGGGGTDPNFASVSLLLHGDGTNGSTSFPDNSSNALTVTAVGNAQVSTSVVKYGTGSMAFDGTGDYLQPSTNNLGAFGTGDFTIEMWVYFNSMASNYVLLDFRSSGGGLGGALYVNTSTLRWYVSAADRITSSSLSATTWYHVALCRSAGVTKLFINGTQTGSSYTDANSYAGNNNRPLIGLLGDGTGPPNLDFNGYIDDLRITKGVARYTANFTPPTAAFPNS